MPKQAQSCPKMLRWPSQPPCPVMNGWLSSNRVVDYFFCFQKLIEPLSVVSRPRNGGGGFVWKRFGFGQRLPSRLRRPLAALLPFAVQHGRVGFVRRGGRVDGGSGAHEAGAAARRPRQARHAGACLLCTPSGGRFPSFPGAATAAQLHHRHPACQGLVGQTSPEFPGSCQ